MVEMIAVVKKKKGTPGRPRCLTHRQLARFLLDYDEGKSPIWLALKYEVGITTVYRYLRRYRADTLQKTRPRQQEPVQEPDPLAKNGGDSASGKKRKKR